jgi:hypothetical protein
VVPSARGSMRLTGRMAVTTGPDRESAGMCSGLGTTP